MYILRDNNTSMGVNVSYTEDGLIWTSNSSGKLIACKDAQISADTTSEQTNGMFTNYIIKGNTNVSRKYYIEPFNFNTPKVFKSAKFNNVERSMSLKAKRMLYNSWQNK